MTLDVTSFIDNKGGNSEEIRESQRKRGHSVEVVDEVIQMYQDWVKRTSNPYLEDFLLANYHLKVDFEANGLSKQSNALQKQIGLKKKVCRGLFCSEMLAADMLILQAKENADDLLAEKKGIDAQIDAKRKESRDAETALRQKAGTIGNIVNKDVPVSQTEVRRLSMHFRDVDTPLYLGRQCHA